VNIFDLRGIGVAGSSERLFLANHPFGGAAGITAATAVLQQIAADPSTPAELRSKLVHVDQGVVVDAALAVVLRDTKISSLVPSMMHVGHLRANVEAIDRSRFSDADAAALRDLLATGRHITVRH
jgi:hypothetical protein